MKSNNHSYHQKSN